MLGIDTPVLLAEIAKSADPTVIQLPVGQAVVSGDVVSLIRSGASRGQLRPANAATENSACVGIALDTANPGSEARVGILGNREVHFDNPITDDDLGSDVFVSPTSGEVTVTAPSATGESVFFVGYLQSRSDATTGTVIVALRRVADL